MEMYTWIFSILVHLREHGQTLYFLFLCFDNNKVVVGSGSEGTPKYMGRV